MDHILKVQYVKGLHNFCAYFHEVYFQGLLSPNNTFIVG